MKRFVVLFSVVVVLAFAASAFAQQFTDFSVDVPEGWTPDEEDGTVIMMGIDTDYLVVIEIGYKGNATLEDIADYYNGQWGGDGLYEVDGFYVFETYDYFGTPADVYVEDKTSGLALADEEYCVLAASQNVSGSMIDTVLASLVSNNANYDNNTDQDNDGEGLDALRQNEGVHYRDGVYYNDGDEEEEESDDDDDDDEFCSVGSGAGALLVCGAFVAFSRKRK